MPGVPAHERLVGFGGQCSVCLLLLGAPGMADVWSLLQIWDSVPDFRNLISTSTTVLYFILFSSSQPCLGHSWVWQSRAELPVKGITPCPSLGLPCSRNWEPLRCYGLAASEQLPESTQHPHCWFHCHIITTVWGFISNSSISTVKLCHVRQLLHFYWVFWQCRREE